MPVVWSGQATRLDSSSWFEIPVLWSGQAIKLDSSSWFETCTIVFEFCNQSDYHALWYT